MDLTFLVAYVLMDLTRGFKGLKQAIKLEFKLGRYDDVSLADNKVLRDISDKKGNRTLPRALDICQIGRHAKLLGQVNKQHARFHRKRLR
jgi:hypothetical protein